MLMTQNLKSLLSNYEKSLSELKFNAFQLYIEDQILKTIDSLKAFNPGTERGRQVHKLIEAEIAKTSKLPSTCAAGCSACCHFEVEITSDEAMILAEIVQSKKHLIDHKSLLSQATREKKDPEWQRQPRHENRCVFLSPQQECGVYESRPSSCRRLLVTTAPSECSDENGSPVFVAIPMAEVVLSAAINLDANKLGPLPKMLQESLNSLPTSTPSSLSI